MKRNPAYWDRDRLKIHRIVWLAIEQAHAAMYLYKAGDVDYLGDNTSLILRNHGLLTVGATVADAFVAMYYLEASCAIQVRAQAGGGELIAVPKEVMDEGYARVAAVQRPRGGQGALVWPGLLRRLDRVDPSYRD